MSKQRQTSNAAPSKLPELLPITAMSMDHRTSIFRRSRSRSLNCPEVVLAHESLTHWLNGWDFDVSPQYRNSPESMQRIVDLLELVKRELTAFEREAPGRYPEFYGKALSPRQGFEAHRKYTQFPAIARALVDYATVPYLAFQPSTKLWGVGQWPAGSPSTHEGMSELPLNFRPYGEVMAAHGILELVRRGALSRIRQCDCKRWYFAIRKDGVACSDTCRKRIHDRKPEVIAKRKENAKKLYKLHKGSQVKEK